ncbi:MAG: 2Fe-2S iron-sulfur cluster binding domain-containing protein, partial [Xanthobacteraceae bacterium]|nr:2Fe-2S iron-sulfur cluster binding domain-containing protein [Xanthobacteraceae bacterium]
MPTPDASAEHAGRIVARSELLFSDRFSSSIRRVLRMASGLILFTYIGAHLVNHALGLISLGAAEVGMEIAIEVWYSLPGTVLLYGAFATHFLMALIAVYERRTFRLPPLELFRIALGFTMPILLIGHAASTRLAYELFGLSSDYTRVVSNIWASGSQGMQLGLMAPGWLHGCLGLHFAFGRRAWYRQSKFVLFSAALLLPVLAALGFIAMGKELATSPTAVAAALEFLKPEHAAQRLALSQWKDSVLNWYYFIIGAAFVAREIRNLLERRSKRLVSVAYPGRTVRVPRGWSVLEASRSFHLPHAAMCGGRARCSTCRVRVTAGEQNLPPPANDEQATLERIGATPDVRLACQLRPQGDISVVPLVRTARPIYRATAPQRGGEREIAVLFCDFRNRADLSTDHLPQDLLYVLTIYVEGVSNAIRASGGTLSHVEAGSIGALFGHEGGGANPAQGALRAAGAIEGVIADLNNRLGRDRDRWVKIAVSIHAGRAAVGEIGSSDPPVLMAVGEAIDGAQELRKAAAARDKAFAISEKVYADADLVP